MVIGGQLNGEVALLHYTKAQTAAQDAASVRPTQGYYGTGIQLGDAVNAVLSKCVECAKAEIVRKEKLNSLLYSGRACLDSRRAEEGLGDFMQADQVANHDAEWSETRAMIHEAETELNRQRQVKGYFAHAIAELKREKAAASAAIRHIEDALKLEAEEGTYEHKQLKCMLRACTAWRRGDEYLTLSLRVHVAHT